MRCEIKQRKVIGEIGRKRYILIIILYFSAKSAVTQLVKKYDFYILPTPTPELSDSLNSLIVCPFSRASGIL
jgi:hypothetical protein